MRKEKLTKIRFISFIVLLLQGSVVPGFGAYLNRDSVRSSHTIKLSSDWKHISFTTPPILDLSFRPALYVDTFQQDKVDTKAKYATPTNPITVFRGDNVNCDQNACGFQVGFFVFRNNSDGKLTTSVKVTNGKYSKTEVVSFEPGKKVADVVIHLPINNGNNKVAVEVDPQNEKAEINEKNNRFEVSVLLKP